MRDQHDGLVVLLPYPLQFEVQPLARQRIERAERLIHQQYLGIARQRPADARALLHAAGQFVWIFVAKILKAGDGEQAVDAIVGRRMDAADAQRQADVLAHVHPGQQIGRLKDHADLARRADHRLAAEQQLALAVRVQSGEQPEQRALSAARGADHADELALPYVERHPVQGVYRSTRSRHIGLRDIADTNECGGIGAGIVP